MICLRAWRVAKNKAGKFLLVDMKFITSWKNSHDFGFDIFEAKHWFKFLSKYTTGNGKLLPRFSKDGDPIAYEVYIWGSSTWMREYMVVGQHPFGKYSLFPAYHKDGSVRDIGKYGGLR